MLSTKWTVNGPVIRGKKAPARRNLGVTTVAHASRNNTPQQTPRHTPEASEDEFESESPFSKLVDFFLNRASSSLKRGTATCLTCKGKGSCDCPLCQGGGVMDKEAARMNMVRHATQKFKEVIHVDRASYNTEWLMTNRCRRCHGTGVIMCPICGGMGVRSPAISQKR